MWLFSIYNRKKYNMSIQLGTIEMFNKQLVHIDKNLTFWIPLDLDSPGIPRSCLDTLRPITFCFCRLTLISNGLTFFSGSRFLFLVLSARFFFFLAISILFDINLYSNILLWLNNRGLLTVVSETASLQINFVDNSA